MRKRTSHWLLVAVAGLFSCAQKKDWPVYRGDKASTGYSSLSQINTSNVGQLEVAWIYHTGDAQAGNRSTMQCNPIVVNNHMYVTSPQLVVLALDPITGKELWRFDPFAGTTATGVNRGVTYWQDNKGDKRIFFTAANWLYALHADNGLPVQSFGNQGRVDLRAGLDRAPEHLSVWATSPGIVYHNLLIQGSSVEEGYDASPGFVRAFNTYSGAIEWTFKTIPPPGEYGFDTWNKDAYLHAGGTNAWAGLSLDEVNGLVYLPLGSPAFDFYGGNRRGQNLFGNCLVALDAATGKRKWHYQLVHHDLWDYDLPAPPTLVTLRNDSMPLAVAQVTKMGMLFVFDRLTGKPVFPIEERPVPASTLPGEYSSPTQPFPLKPVPFSRQELTENDLTDLSDSSRNYVKALIGNAQTGGIYRPPDTTGIVQIPGTRGGAEWGGASFDPETGYLYINANELPLLLKMKPLAVSTTQHKGEQLYSINNCGMCHGANQEGVGSFPSLQKIEKRLSEQQIDALLQTGRGQMPAFRHLLATDRQALIRFLTGKEKNTQKAPADTGETRFVNNGWTQLVDQHGYPGIKPPWGTLHAIDLNKGKTVWTIALGEYPELTEKGIPATGTPNLGGSVVTAGGLLIIAATRDEKLRIFNKKSGAQIWQFKLPAGGYATPATYMANGKQYIVIAAGGGGKLGSPSGDAYIAFTLKNN